MAGEKRNNDLSIIDGLSEKVVGFFRNHKLYTTLLDISFGLRVEYYEHNGLYVSKDGGEIIENPEDTKNHFAVWDVTRDDRKVYRRTIDFPVEYQEDFEERVESRLKDDWVEDRVKIEDTLYRSFTNSVVRVIFLHDQGLLRLITSENITDFKKFYNTDLNVAETANDLFPFIRRYLCK